MVIDESELTKGQLRKLNALRRSVGDDLAEDVFAKWLTRQAAPQTKDKTDPIAVKIILGSTRPVRQLQAKCQARHRAAVPSDS